MRCGQGSRGFEKGPSLTTIRFDKMQVTGAFDVIMRRKFVELYDWEIPDLVQTVGPYEPDLFSEYAAKIDQLLDVAFQVLTDATDVELDAIIADDRNEQTGARKQWRELFAREISLLRKHRPFWAEGGFGHPDYVADFEYWGRMPSLLLDEAVGLTLGVEPKHFKNLLNEDDETLLYLGKPMIFAKRRAEQFSRQFHVSRHNQKIPADDLLKWIRTVDLEVHAQALNVLERFHGCEGVPTRKTQREDPRAVRAVARILTAIAIEEYGYDPKSPRSPIPNEILGIMDRLGLQGSAETVLKYLRIGSADLPPD